MAIVFGVDPFQFFGVVAGRPAAVKKKIAYPLNYPLWSLTDFKRFPTPHILLGDSRMNRMEKRVVDSITGLNFSKLSYGGGTLPEIFETFWFAADRISLKDVYIGINFNLYNAFNRMNRVKATQSIFDNPFLYFTDRSVLKAGLALIKTVEEAGVKDIERPKMSHTAFWDFQLSVTTRGFYQNYKYPGEYFVSLGKIKTYCEKKGINLVFIIFPSHMDLQGEVTRHRLSKAYRIFKGDLVKLGKVIDFDYENDFTLNREAFADPYHPTWEASRSIMAEIFGSGPKKLGRVLGVDR